MQLSTLDQKVLEQNNDCVQVQYVGPKTPIQVTVYSKVWARIPYGQFVHGDTFFAHKIDAENNPHLSIIDNNPEPKAPTRKKRAKKEA